MNEERLVRMAEREAAKRAREAELAKQAARAAELGAQAQRVGRATRRRQKGKLPWQPACGFGPVAQVARAHP